MTTFELHLEMRGFFLDRCSRSYIFEKRFGSPDLEIHLEVRIALSIFVPIDAASPIFRQEKTLSHFSDISAKINRLGADILPNTNTVNNQGKECHSKKKYRFRQRNVYLQAKS